MSVVGYWLGFGQVLKEYNSFQASNVLRTLVAISSFHSCSKHHKVVLTLTRRSPRLAAAVFKPHLRQCHRYFSVHFSQPCKNGHWQKELIRVKKGTLSLRQERPIIHSLRSLTEEAHAVSEKERKKTFAIHRPRRRRRLCGVRCAMGGGGVCGALGQSEIGVHFPGEEGRERQRRGRRGGGEEARAGNHRGEAGSERMGGTAAAGCLVCLLACLRDSHHGHNNN